MRNTTRIEDSTRRTTWIEDSVCGAVGAAGTIGVVGVSCGWCTKFIVVEVTMPYSIFKSVFATNLFYLVGLVWLRRSDGFEKRSNGTEVLVMNGSFQVFARCR